MAVDWAKHGINVNGIAPGYISTEMNEALLANAEFTTLRLRLIKIAARVRETASRVRIAFAAAHPEADLFASLARCLHPGGP